jgi:hypothetical protein
MTTLNLTPAGHDPALTSLMDALMARGVAVAQQAESDHAALLALVDGAALLLAEALGRATSATRTPLLDATLALSVVRQAADREVQP